MSYHDEFSTLYSKIQSAEMHAKAIGMSRALVEIPDLWFREHRLQPVGRQSMDRMTWLVSVNDIWHLWRETNPTTRWKEVY